MNPDTWRLLGVAVGVVIGSALGVAVVWTLVYLRRRDVERRRAERSSVVDGENRS